MVPKPVPSADPGFRWSRDRESDRKRVKWVLRVIGLPPVRKTGFRWPQFRKTDPYLGGTNRLNHGGNPLFSGRRVSRIPLELSDVEASTLPCAALTAWSALVEEGRLKSGDSVLIQGTGGVSLFALQFAKMMGVRAMVISGSEEKMQRAGILEPMKC